MAKIGSTLLHACFALNAFAELPPLIGRELFFANPEIANATISPDGQYVAFVKPFEGTRNIWIKKTTETREFYLSRS